MARLPVPLPGEPTLQNLMKRRLTTVPALVAVALGGCGGTNIELDLTASAGSGYPEAAEGICTEVGKRFAEAQGESPKSFEQAAELMSALVELARQGEEAMAQVDPPPEAEADFQRYLDARAEAVAQLERGLEAAQAGDGSAYEKARAEAIDGAAERERLAKRAGLRRCAAVEKA